MTATMTSNTTTKTPRPGRSPLRIERAGREDMSTIAGIISSSAEWYRDIVDEADMNEHEVGAAWAEANFGLREFYLGYVGDTPIGTISLQYFGDHAYLGYIYLDVEHVGEGFGGRLMKHAEQVARDRDMAGLALIAHPEATWAQRAYLKYGFEIVEHERTGVLAWQDGALEPHYEEGFQLYTYSFDDESQEIV